MNAMFAAAVIAAATWAGACAAIGRGAADGVGHRLARLRRRLRRPWRRRSVPVIDTASAAEVIDPRIATPRAPPISPDVSLTAEPSPHAGGSGPHDRVGRGRHRHAIPGTDEDEVAATGG